MLCIRIFSVTALLALAGSAGAATIASWSNSALNVNGSIAAAGGNATLSRGSALAYINTANVYNSSQWKIGVADTEPTFGNRYVQIALNATGAAGLSLNFTDQRNANGPTAEEVWYSSNGGASFTLAATHTPADGVSNARVVDLSAISALDNNPNVVFRIHGHNAATNGGNLRFSNISITGTDLLPPTVNSIVRAGVNPTNSTTVNFTVTFSEPVTGVAADNFTVVGSGVTGSIGTITGSGTTWTVPVTPVSGNGTLKIDLDQNIGNIADASSNAMTAPFTAGQSYDIDQAAPAVSSIVPTNPSPTFATTVNFTVTFNEAVTGVAANNFSLVSTGTASGTIGAVTGTGTTRNVSVNTVAGNGTLRLDMTSNLGNIRDTANNAPTSTFTTGGAYTIDQRPVVVSIVRADATPNKGPTVNFTVTFNESVSGVAANNFTVVGTGGVTGTVGTVTGSGTTWNVAVDSIAGNGTVKINLAQNLANIVDSVGFTPAVAFTTGQTYTIDQLAPVVNSINRTNASPTAATTLNFTVTFNEAVTGVTAGNFTLVASGVTGVIGAVTGTGTTRNVQITSVSGSGTLRLNLDQNLSTILDAAGNSAVTAFTTGQIYNVDNVAPTVVSITRTGSTPTNAATLSFLVTFSETVTGVALNNFAVGASAGVTGTISSVTGTGSTRTVNVTGVTGDGTLKINLSQNLANIRDSLNNSLTNAFTTGEEYTLIHPSFTVEAFTLSLGDGDQVLDPSECNEAQVTVRSTGVTALTNLSGVLTSTTPGVFVTQDSSPYPDLAMNESGSNSLDFLVSTTSSFGGVDPVPFVLTVQTVVGPIAVPFQSTAPPRISSRFDNSTPISITDSPRSGRSSTTESPMVVSGLSGAVADVTVTLHINHPRDNDLRISLVAPDGTIVSLASKRGGQGDNFGTGCAEIQRTGFSDAAATAIGAAGAPFVGTFRPEQAFSLLLKNKPASAVNGVWKLRIADTKSDNVGTLQCWSLGIAMAELQIGSGSCVATPTAELSISKLGSPAAPLNGGTLTYDLTVTNEGPYTANNVTMLDALPDQVVFGSATVSGGGTYSETNGLFSANWPFIPSGESRTVQIVTNVVEAGTVINTATVSANEEDTNAADSTATEVNTVGPVANLVVTNTPSANNIQTGGSAAYVVNVTNNGPDIAEDVTLEEIIPAGVVVGSVVSTSGTATVAGNIVTLPVGSLGLGGTVLMTVPVTSTVCGPLTALASADNDDADNNPSDNTNVPATINVQDPAPTIDIGSPSVGLTNTGPLDFPVTYTGAQTHALTPAFITLNSVGNATGTVSVLNGSTATPTVRISSISGDGSLGISIGSGSATACGGLGAPAAGPSSSATIDNVQPVVSGVVPVNGTTVDISFTEANGFSASVLDPAMYTVSGPGQGTTNAQPDSVAHVAGNTYRLTWNSGNMVLGQLITVTVANGPTGVSDGANNEMGAQNSGGAAALPVSLSVLSIE